MGSRSRGHPCGHVSGGVVIVDGRVLDPDAEARQQFVEVGAVLVFLRLSRAPRGRLRRPRRPRSPRPPRMRTAVSRRRCAPTWVADGCAMTRTSTSPSAAPDNEPLVYAATSKSRSARAAAAAAYDAAAGCSGRRAAATSGRIDQASPWDSSKTMRATLRWRSGSGIKALLSPAAAKKPQPGRRNRCGVPVVPWPAPDLNPGPCGDARRDVDAGEEREARRRQTSRILVRTSTVPPPSGLRRSKSSTTARMMEMPMPPSLSLSSGMFWHSGQSTSSS